MKELKSICWQYITVIDQLSNGKIDAAAGEQKRRELHHKILELTGLSAFEFGGLPFWWEIESVEMTATKLYNALVQKCASKD